MDPARGHRQERPGRAAARPDLAAPSHRDHAWAAVAPYRERLVALARGHGLPADDAQDVAHHAMCAVVERGADPLRLGAVLAKAVERRSREVLAEAERQERLLARTRADDRLVGRVDEAVCEREHLAWLLAKLPERERRVVVLSSAGTTVTGIAELTGLSYPTVDRLLSRARREMRRLAAGAGVVGLALWRQRRPALAPATAAVAAVTMLAAPVRTPYDAPPAREAVRTVPAVALAGRPAPRPAVRVAPAIAARAAAAARPQAPAERAATRRPVVDAGPVRVTGSDDDPVERIGQCLRNGVAVRLARHGGVVCREDPTVTVKGAP